MNETSYTFAPQGLIRRGFDLTFYSDRPENRYGGLLHGWGPLSGGMNNPAVDMLLVHIHWWQTHVAPKQGDFTHILEQIEKIHAAGKKVYLYPHPSFPPDWSGIQSIDQEWGWIDYLDESSHKLQLEWYELIAKAFGKDERVHAIRMSTFDHGEAWIHPPRKLKLDEAAEKRGVTPSSFVHSLIIDIYEIFLLHVEPNKLIAHGGGLQGECLEWAIARGTGHGTGTHQLDFAGIHHYPRKISRLLENGHLSLFSMREESKQGMYIAESQCWSGWEEGDDLDIIKQAALCLLCSNIVHKTNYLMLDEMIYNRQSYRRISNWAAISPDTTGRLTRRGDESAKVWTHDEDIYQMAMWTRTLLGTDDDTSPEAFVQLSRHYSFESNSYVECLEHGMVMDLERSSSIPVIEGNHLGTEPYIREVFGFRSSYFAKRTDRENGHGAFYFSLNNRFQRSLLNKKGELLEVRVTYKDLGAGEFELLYEQHRNGKVSAGRVNLESAGEWRTACFLVSDPAIHENCRFDLELISHGEDIIVSLIRCLKQY